MMAVPCTVRPHTILAISKHAGFTLIARSTHELCILCNLLRGDVPSLKSFQDVGLLPQSRLLKL
jgi:hypothetical protein